MIYKRQRIIKKAVVIYELPDIVKGYASTVKGNLYNKKYVFNRITEVRIFSCSGCVLEGKCDGIYTVQSSGVIKKYCREQDKFFDIHVFYRCYSEETIPYIKKADIYVTL
jgi:hypothetical protein